MNNSSEKRDQLALERTRLANERTLLAYIRTGLSLFAAAALLMHFASSFKAYMPLAMCATFSGISILIFGVVRFFKVKKSL